MNAYLLSAWRSVFTVREGSIPTELRAALNTGNTITTRLWVALFSLMLATQLALDQPSLFSNVSIKMFFLVVPSTWWSVGLYVSGGLMLWRVFARVPRPWAAWLSNGINVGVWGSILIIRISSIGPYAVTSSSTIVLIMAIWCLLRTEATARDAETA